MFEQRNIVYLTNYRFKNNKIQNVYILILSVIDNNLICLVKTSTQQYINIRGLKVKCIKEQNISKAFYIPPSQKIGESNYHFPDHTYIYFNQTIKHKTADEINQNCSKIELKDKMVKEIFIDLLYCSIHSKQLKPSVLERFENYLENEIKKE